MVFRLGWVLLLAAITAGCRERMADQLLGRWIGRPDTAVARGTREAGRYQDLAAGPAPTGRQVEAKSSAEDQQDSPLLAVPMSDWERYDVRILLEFADAQRVHMSLADGSEPRSGVWRVVQQTPVGLVIEIETRARGLDEGQVVTPLGSTGCQRRRFELQFDYDHRSARGQRCIGFRLVELGADPRLGAIYFKRAKSSEGA